MSSEQSRNTEQKAETKDLGRESRLSFRNFAEHQKRQELKEKAMEICKDDIRQLAECSQEKGLMVVFSCNSYFKNLSACLNKYNGEEAWQRFKAEHEEEIDAKAHGIKPR